MSVATRAPTFGTVQKTKLQLAIAAKIASSTRVPVKITKFTTKKRKQVNARYNGMTPKEARKERGRIFQAQKREKMRNTIEGLEKAIAEMKSQNEKLKTGISSMSTQIDKLISRTNASSSSCKNDVVDENVEHITTRNVSGPAPIRRPGPRFGLTLSPTKLPTPPRGWNVTDTNGATILSPPSRSRKSRQMVSGSSADLDDKNTLYKGAKEPFAFMDDGGGGSGGERGGRRGLTLKATEPRIKEDPFSMDDELVTRFSPLSLTLRSPRGGILTDPFAWFTEDPRRGPPSRSDTHMATTLPSFCINVSHPSVDSTPDSAFVNDENMLFSQNSPLSVQVRGTDSEAHKCVPTHDDEDTHDYDDDETTTSNSNSDDRHSRMSVSEPIVECDSGFSTADDDGFYSGGLSTASMDNTNECMLFSSTISCPPIPDANHDNIPDVRVPDPFSPTGVAW